MRQVVMLVAALGVVAGCLNPMTELRRDDARREVEEARELRREAEATGSPDDVEAARELEREATRELVEVEAEASEERIGRVSETTTALLGGILQTLGAIFGVAGVAGAAASGKRS